MKLSKGVFSISGKNELSMDTLYDGYCKPGEGLETVRRLYPRMESGLLRSPGDGADMTWSIKADYYQYELAAMKLRDILAGKDQQHRIKKAMGHSGMASSESDDKRPGFGRRRSLYKAQIPS